MALHIPTVIMSKDNDQLTLVSSSFFQILNFMHAQSTYFHQGYDLMNDLDVYMKKVSKQVSEKTQESIVPCTSTGKFFLQMI